MWDGRVKAQLACVLVGADVLVLRAGKNREGSVDASVYAGKRDALADLYGGFRQRLNNGVVIETLTGNYCKHRHAVPLSLRPV